MNQNKDKEAHKTSNQYLGIAARLDKLEASDVTSSVVDLEAHVSELFSRITAINEKRKQNEEKTKQSWENMASKITQQEEIINDLTATIYQQRDELEAFEENLAYMTSTQDKVISNQRDELGALTQLPLAYATRVRRSLLEKDDTQTLEKQYAMSVRRGLEQAAEIKIMKWSTTALKRKIDMLTMDLDIKSIELTASDMKCAKNEAKHMAIRQSYVQIIEKQEKEIERLTTQNVQQEETNWHAGNANWQSQETSLA